MLYSESNETPWISVNDSFIFLVRQQSIFEIMRRVGYNSRLLY